MDARRRLIGLLRVAYSGELGAALAYRGHARSVVNATERGEIEKIEGEERDHRETLRAMLSCLGARPDPAHERRARLIGGALAVLCRWTGWFMPMYLAGQLERRNIDEYEVAARAAAEAGHGEFVEPLREMAAAEAEHERYFRRKTASHRLFRYFGLKA
jgi:demethoxyubiquinone hydroxylase (CLK1/Coq7/Cat5 family)